VTAETCPHYLFFAAEEIPDGATEFKCAPPIRERENRERLWTALGEGVLDMIVSDHSPAPPELKHREAGDFARAWGGISSLGLTLAAAWTAASERGYSVADLARWMCAGPASFARLADWKGTIAVGKNADLVVWNPEARWTVDPARLRTRHRLTPYAGRELKGVVEATYLKGEKIYAGGEVLPGPRGEILLSG
jgi:allantoinase